MDEEGGDERREESRRLTDLDVQLREPGGAVVEQDGRALDISPDGFKLVSRAKLERGMRFLFTLDLKDGTPVTGEIELAWAREDGWGGSEAGAKFINISWADRRRLKAKTYTPGYDFTKPAMLVARLVFIAVVIVGLGQVMLNEPHMRSALLQALPAVLIAAAAIAVVLSLLKG